MTSLVSQATICFVHSVTFICISVYLLSVISGNRLCHYVVHFDCICAFLLIHRCFLSSFYVLCIVLSICASAWYATLGWAGCRLAKLRISYLTNGRRHDELKL